jgi:hypothetical protein
VIPPQQPGSCSIPVRYLLIIITKINQLKSKSLIYPYTIEEKGEYIASATKKRRFTDLGNENIIVDIPVMMTHI